MLRKKLKEIRKIYESLPYVVLKGKYLVPQQPKPIRGGNIIGANDNIATLYKQVFPQKLNAELMNRIHDASQRQQLAREFRQELKMKKQQIRQQIKKYEQKYIKPLKQPKVNSVFLFYNQHSQEIQDEFKQEGRKYNLVSLYEFFKKAPQDIRQKYILRAEQLRKEKIQMTPERVKQMQQHLIPEVKVVRSDKLYMQEVKVAMQRGDEVPKYNKLSKEVRQALMSRCKLLKQERQARLIDFLTQKGLSINEFNNIKQICIQMKQVNRQWKKHLRKQLQLKSYGRETNEAVEGDQVVEQWDQEEEIQVQIQKEQQGDELREEEREQQKKKETEQEQMKEWENELLKQKEQTKDQVKKQPSEMYALNNKTQQVCYKQTRSSIQAKMFQVMPKRATVNQKEEEEDDNMDFGQSQQEINQLRRNFKQKNKP